MEIEQQLHYQVWATSKFIDLVKPLSESEWNTEVPVVNKSLQEIYIHKMEVLWFWFSLCKKKSLQLLGEPPNFKVMTKEVLLHNLLNLYSEMKDFALEHNDKLSLDLNWMKKPYEITTHELIYNILNHDSYHRGQIAILLKYFHIDVPETSYNPYMFEKNHLYE